jgi:uncharacterized membrane protein YdjX (TVP38/TMEM64 family)
MNNHYRTAIKWISIAVMAVSGLWAIQALPLQTLMESLNQWVAELGFWGPVLFSLIYVLATICFVPGLILTLAAGATFGLAIGFATVSIGSVVGAAGAFLIARFFARRQVEKFARSNRRFAAIDQAVGIGGWKIVGLLRLSPAVPFNLQNYLYGLTSIPFWPYVLVSWIAMAPATLMYVYIGHVAGVAASGEQASVARWSLIGVGFLATVVVTVYVTYLARQQLRQINQQPIEPIAAGSEAEIVASGTSTANGKPYGYLLAAAGMLALAVTAHSKSDAIERWWTRVTGRPPIVEMREAYPNTTGGPTIDHGRLTQLLQQHVDDAGWVDYKALQQDRDKLNDYITQISNVPFDELNRNEKLALLINAYNAFTLQLVLEHLPIDSILDIPAPDRWDAIRWRIGNNTWSLNQIEHEQIRPKFFEPRIHFALVCAAVGCPPLARQAYDANRLAEQLAAQTRYVHDHHTWLQTAGDTLRLTKLYRWYAGDFQQAAGSVLEFVAGNTNRVDPSSSPRIEYLDYDWSLNSLKNRQPR